MENGGIREAPNATASPHDPTATPEPTHSLSGTTTLPNSPLERQQD